MHHFGKVGQYHYKIARAEDDRPAHPNRIRKSIGAENSYDPDLSERAQIETALEEEADTLLRQLDSQRTVGRTLTLKVKYADYQQVTRSRTLATPIGNRPGTDARSPAGSPQRAEFVLRLSAIDDAAKSS